MKKKGSYGYIPNRRILMIILFVILLAADLTMFFVSKAYFGTVKNLFTIFVVLVCLPIGMIGVNAVLFIRASGCSEAAHDAIEKSAETLPGLYDLYLTSYSKNFQLSHAAVGNGSIIALTESPKCDAKAGEEHIRSMLSGNGIKGYNVKIFTNQGKYCERLHSLDSMQEGAGKASAEAAIELLKALSI